MSTPLHKRMLSFEHEDERGDLMREVWAPTPWMINLNTRSDADYGLIRRWCFARFGDESSTIHGRPGTWRFGNATVMGWTWIGFSTEEQMREFIAAWPGKTTEEEV
jgi:hypothetical protein